jgi:NAD(P)H dehydrogenase (quinone)
MDLMQNRVISIVYHSKHGHTEQAAKLLAASMHCNNIQLHVLSVREAGRNWQLLHSSDTIVFGCPALLGNVSAKFKEFMEETGAFWYRQLWKNKLAAAFTVSSTVCGDKSNTLQSIATFAAQHSMHWINPGILPRFLNDEQTEGQNRLSGYQGLMMQSNNSQKQVAPFHPGDLLTLELFAKRIIDVTMDFKQHKINNYDTIRN